MKKKTIEKAKKKKKKTQNGYIPPKAGSKRSLLSYPIGEYKVHLR